MDCPDSVGVLAGNDGLGAVRPDAVAQPTPSRRHLGSCNLRLHSQTAVVTGNRLDYLFLPQGFWRLETFSLIFLQIIYMQYAQHYSDGAKFFDHALRNSFLRMLRMRSG